MQLNTGLMRSISYFLVVPKLATLWCISQGIIQSYDRQLSFVDKAKVIVIAYTAKAAFNVSGDKFHQTLGHLMFLDKYRVIVKKP